MSQLSLKEINIINKVVLNNCFKICVHNGYLELFKLFEKYCSSLLTEDAFQFQYITLSKKIYIENSYNNFCMPYENIEIKESNRFFNTILYNVLLNNKSEFVYNNKIYKRKQKGPLIYYK